MKRITNLFDPDQSWRIIALMFGMAGVESLLVGGSMLLARSKGLAEFLLGAVLIIVGIPFTTLWMSIAFDLTPSTRRVKSVIYRKKPVEIHGHLEQAP